MSEIRQRRAVFLVAFIAIAAVLFLLLAPQAHSGNSTAWLIVLPVFFVGLLLPLNPLWRAADHASDHAPESAFQLASFQRPPPVRLG
jgi:hypothetical protein